MAEWLFDKGGSPCLILDGSCVRDDHGVVVGWVNDSDLYLLHGQHVGWFEGGVIYDTDNCALAFSTHRTGYLPHLPRVGDTQTLQSAGQTGIFRDAQEARPRRVVMAGGVPMFVEPR